MGIVSYGGDPQIVATRAEIERIQAGLASVGNLLGGEVELADFLVSPLKRIGLAMELPAVQERIRYLLQALDAAAGLDDIVKLTAARPGAPASRAGSGLPKVLPFWVGIVASI